MTEDWPGGGRRPTVVTLMAEHGGVLLWNDSPARDPVADDLVVDPAHLGVSPGLVDRMTRWNSRFEALAFTDFEWPGAEEERAWVREGLSIAHDLQHELGPDVAVVYAHDGDPRPVGERRGR